MRLYSGVFIMRQRNIRFILTAGELFALALIFLLTPSLQALGEASNFRPGVVRYRAEELNGASALQTLQRILKARTSVRVGRNVADVSINNLELYQHPFTWMCGEDGFERLSTQSIDNLRRYLQSGGTLIIDDTSAEEDSEFLRSVRRMLSRIFPSKPLRPVPEKHAIYRSFYHLEGPAGLHRVSDTLHAVSVDDRAAVIISPNDLTEALQRQTGTWRHPISSARKDEREMCLRLAINLAIYALTVNYKLDQVHVSYQLRHPNRYPEADSVSPPEESGQR